MKTLKDFFEPNQFGTVPTMNILGIGTVTKYDDHSAIISIDDRPNEYISQCAECTEHPTKGFLVDHARVCMFNTSKLFIVPATPENLMLTMLHGNGEYEHVFVKKHGTHALVIYPLDEILNNPKTRLLDNGTGWIDSDPVEVFLCDILHRLDLQNKTK